MASFSSLPEHVHSKIIKYVLFHQRHIPANVEEANPKNRSTVGNQIYKEKKSQKRI